MLSAYRTMFALSVMLGILGPAPSLASEESRRLVTTGYVAYDAGRYDEARDLFAQAVAADGTDAEARYALGRALAKLGRWAEAAGAFAWALARRPGFDQARVALDDARLQVQRSAEAEAVRARESGAKPWEIHATTGIEYDSNVTLAPDLQAVSGGKSRRDMAFVLAAGGSYDALRRQNALVRLEYDFYQTVHPRVGDFDFESHNVRGTASYELHPALWAGVQGGYEHYLLGSESYLSEPFVIPFLSLLERGWGLTQLTYRHGQETFLSQPFHDVRDGPIDDLGLAQTLYLGPRRLTLGYQFESERPTRSAGNDYRLRSNGGYVAVGLPAWWLTAIDVMYLYRADHYTDLNSFTGFTKRRQDSVHYLYAAVSRPIAQHVSATIAYYGTFNGSNIELFDYQRSVVSTFLTFTF